MHLPQVDIPEEVRSLLQLTEEEEKAHAQELKALSEPDRWRKQGARKYPKVTLARAVSVHEHPMTRPYGARSQMWFRVPLEKYVTGRDRTAEDIIAHDATDDEWVESRFRRYNVRGTPIAWDDTTQHGGEFGVTSNDYVAWLCHKYPDVFPTAWAGVDPHKEKVALAEIERAIKQLGLIGVKFQQAAQRFVPNDRQWYPMWDLLQELGCPVQLHCGYTGVGGGPAGGLGVNPLHFTNPYWIDFVCADFPRLNVVGCHPAWPFEDMALAICMHKGNFYREISGRMPRYFDPNMVHEMNTRQQNKYMFGAESPSFQMDEIFRQHVKLNYRPNIWEKLMYKNTEAILGISRDASKDRPEWPSRKNLKLKRWFNPEEEAYWRVEGVQFEG
ncbi:MAG: amidohydrolase family protein [Chloroflexi bacterium]|nr:amidohydrolase family protein [Chloroflexota bacterium]